MIKTPNFVLFMSFVVRADFLIDPVTWITAPENLRAPRKLSAIITRSFLWGALCAPETGSWHSNFNARLS
jgi:hypothetical protein